MSTVPPSTPLFDAEPRRQPADPVQDAAQHPHAEKRQPKGPVDFILIHEHPSYLYRVRDDKRTRTGPQWQVYFEEFAADIAMNGVLQPVIAVRYAGRAIVVDGQTRVDAALLTGLQSIPIMLYERELTESEIVIAQLTSNTKRRGFEEFELATIYLELMKLNGWNQATLAKNIHVKPSQVSKILSINNNLCEAAQALLLAGKLPARAAYALSRLEPERQMTVAQEYVDGIICVQGIEGRVADILSGRKKHQKPWIFKAGDASATIKGDLAEGAKNLISKLQEILKRLRGGDDPRSAIA